MMLYEILMISQYLRSLTVQKQSFGGEKAESEVSFSHQILFRLLYFCHLFCFCIDNFRNTVV